MRVLVTAASRHGATMGIAQAIADELTLNELAVDMIAVEDVSSLVEFDAVVLGSAIYYGHWLKDAVEFADLFFEELSQRPLWLFSSGPVESAPSPTSTEADPDSSPIKGALLPRDHQVFRGSLDKSQLSVAERALTRVVRADYGDFRDWDQVRSWARTIAADLTRRDSDPG